MAETRAHTQSVFDCKPINVNKKRRTECIQKKRLNKLQQSFFDSTETDAEKEERIFFFEVPEAETRCKRELLSRENKAITSKRDAKKTRARSPSTCKILKSIFG